MRGAEFQTIFIDCLKYANFPLIPSFQAAEAACDERGSKGASLPLAP
jgi:hypothetical protein